MILKGEEFNKPWNNHIRKFDRINLHGNSRYSFVKKTLFLKSQF